MRKNGAKEGAEIYAWDAGTGGLGMIEYAVLGKFLGQFEALLDNVINETSGKTTETIFREMRDRLDEVMNDE